jgi:hypothetical protein
MTRRPHRPSERALLADEVVGAGSFSASAQLRRWSSVARPRRWH